MSTSTLAEKHDETKAHFRDLFSLFEKKLNGHRDQPIHGIRQQAMSRLDVLDFPTRRDEDWKYTSVNRLLQPSYQDAYPVSVTAEMIGELHIDDLNACRLVFVNGILDPSLSDLERLPAGIQIMDTAHALQDEHLKAGAGAFLHQLAQAGSNPFLALNMAFAKDSQFIYIPKNARIEQPIHMLYVAAPTEGPVFINPQHLIIAEANSEVSIVETYHSLPGVETPYFTNAVHRILVGENAFVHHYKIQKESREGFQIRNTEVYQHRDSTYASYVLDLGGRLVRNNLSAILQGENTMTHFYGVYLIDGEQHIDNQTFIDHALPHCNSNELYKGIIRDKGRGVFNGKVMVRKDAQKTNAFQQNSNLVLSPAAAMDTKPQLEIFADDVKCSHGATIGQLDESSVFYLRSRGLSDPEARALLQHAFLMEVLEQMPLEAVRSYAETLISEKFAGKA